MSERAEALARRFEQINGEVIAFVERCDDAAWQTEVLEEQRTVAVVAHHVASAYPAVTGWITSLAAGQPVAITMERIHELNARHKAHFAHPTQAEVLDLLRDGGAAAAQAVRALDDQQLDTRAAFGPAGNRPLSAAQVAEYVLITHPTGHLTAMRQALGQ
jgi:hypothetical protein